MLSVSSTPIFAKGLPSGPMTKGTTYIVRPFMQPVEELAQLGVGLLGVHPVVGRPGVRLVGRADEREVLDARHVVGVGAVQVAAGPLLLVERDEDALLHRLLRQALLLLLGAVAPDDAVRLRHLGAAGHPGQQGRVLRRRVPAAASCVEAMEVSSCRLKWSSRPWGQGETSRSGPLKSNTRPAVNLPGEQGSSNFTYQPPEHPLADAAVRRGLTVRRTCAPRCRRLL